MALPPRIVERGGVRYIAPVDTDCSGTWVAANEFGLSVCLLNGDPRVSPAGPHRSRGLLIRELAWARSASECVLWSKQLDFRSFAPFTLVVLEPERSATLAHWDGKKLAIDPDGDAHMPLTSSSFDASGVRQSRLNEFARRLGPGGTLDPALLYWFHSSHGISANAYSPCMHREDAETVSFSWVIVTREAVRFLYLPAAPCRCSPSEQQILPRAA